MLSTSVPDNINCKDSSGKKQGWWIYYKVDSNPSEIPDVLSVGNYVDRYSYGKYENDKKAGKWTEVFNVHLICERRVDLFYNKKDTVSVYSTFADMGQFESIVDYIKDSSIITAKRMSNNDTMYIYCNKNNTKKNEACKMIYHNKTIKKFPYTDFEWRFGEAEPLREYYKWDK